MICKCHTRISSKKTRFLSQNPSITSAANQHEARERLPMSSHGTGNPTAQRHQLFDMELETCCDQLNI